MSVYPVTSFSFKLDMLSPPLSPYQRVDTPPVKSKEKIKESKIDKSSIKSFLNNKPFNIENFNNYDLKLNPWTNLKDYKSNQFDFLEKYNILKVKEQQQTVSLRPKKRKIVSHFFESDSDDKIRTRRSTKELTELSDSNLSSNNSTSPKKRRVATPQPVTIDENIPDYSPSVDTLPNNNKCLKVEWKGQPMDLSNDPHVDKLHPAELYLASNLRLSAILYLDSKKRFFHEKVNRLKEGKPFRRTDAQKACRIDVNKASRLFQAFEKVGWLNDNLFKDYL